MPLAVYVAGEENVAIGEPEVISDVGLNVELAAVQLPVDEVEDRTVVVAFACTSVFVIVMVDVHSQLVTVVLLASTTEGTNSATKVAVMVGRRIAD